MEFLLLLSAFVSALTGAITGARAIDLRPGQAVVAACAIRAAQPVVLAAATERPAAAGFALTNHLAAGPSASFAIIAAVPLYVSRLRV